MSADLEFSIIICAYTLDRWDELSGAVESARRQTLKPREVILVVDNNDELLHRAATAFPDVVVVENTGIPGLGDARNAGVAVATGAILAFMDDDAIAADDWLEQLRPGYDDPTVLGVGGFIEPLWPDRAPRWFPTEFNWVVGCTYTGVPTHTTTVRNLIGANMSVRAEVVEAAGGFDGSLGRHERPGRAATGTAEETEFCIRASRVHPGRQWQYRPSARVAHVVSDQRTTWRFFTGRCRVEGASKADLVNISGSQSGLASERSYVLRTLPSGVLRELGAALRGKVDGAARAGAIVAGFWLTTMSYVRGRVGQAFSKQAAPTR